jgi:hypothetical protein
MAKNETDDILRKNLDKAQLVIDQMKTRAMNAAVGFSDKEIRGLDKRLTSMTIRIHELRMRGYTKEADYLQGRMGKMAGALANPKNLRQLGDGLSHASETFGAGLHSAFAAFKSKDLGSMLGMAKKFGEASKKGGAAMEANTAKGGVGATIAGLGKFMVGMGATLAIIAGVAGGIALLVKVILDADSAIKDMNKSMIEAGIAGQEFGTNVEQGMDWVRSAFSGKGAIDYLNEFGTTTKENIAILGAFQKAGTTFTELTAGIEDSAKAQERLRDAARSAVVYSKLLGESSDKVAGDMAKMAEETATTLEGVRDRFSEIAAAAKQSGFDTKRFYGMVLEVTTGMSMYNVRLQDTIGLLMQAGKVLGPDAGKAWAMSLKGHAEESTRDRAVNVMKMDPKDFQTSAKLDAKTQASSLKDAFASIQESGTDKQKAALTEALDKAGLKDFANMGSADIAEKLGAMKDTDALRAGLNQVQATLGTKTAGAAAVARGGRAGATLGEKAYAMQNMGQVGTLSTKIRGSSAVSKNTNLDTMKPEDLINNIARESLNSGAGAVTNDDRNMLRDAIGQLKNEGTPVTLEGILDKVGLMTKLSDDDAKKAADDAAKKEIAWKTDQAIATDIKKGIYSLSDNLGMRIEQWLMSINEGIYSILEMNPLYKGQTKEDKSEKGKAIAEQQTAIEKLTEDLKTAETPEKKEDIQELIDFNKKVLTGIQQDTTTTGQTGQGRINAAAQQERLKRLTPEEREAMDAEKKLATDKIDRDIPLLGMPLTPEEYADRVAKSDEEIEAKSLKNSKAFQEREAKKKKRDDIALAEKNTKDMADALAKTMNESKIKEMAFNLSEQGMDEGKAKELARIYLEGGKITDKKDRKAVQAAQVRDGLLTVESGNGRQMYRIDDQDQVAIGKPGGPISKGGGGNVTVYVQQWGDVPKAIETAIKTLRI